MRIIQLLGICLCVACSAENTSSSDASGGSAAGGAGTTGRGGESGSATTSGGNAGNGGAPANGGADSSGGAPPGSGGTPSEGGTPSAGRTSSGGTSSGGTRSQGGAPSGGTATNEGGSAASAGASAGDAGRGGTSASGASGVGGINGDAAAAAQALEGLRLDDGCQGPKPASVPADGAVCNHATLTNNQFRASKFVTIAGTAGTTYDVTLRVRGIAEAATISGGMRPDTSTFTYKNDSWRKVPFTIGGTLQSADYQHWKIAVGSPKQDYYLNDYQKTGHFIFALDYQVTIPMAANTTVTLDCYDSNERMITNYENYTLDGIPGSINYGQFVQLSVVSVKAR